eukprot:TRINITY_DN18253_c0_g1_i1.p1 TRINITY_DN18253_c0_g1~~TRINITY_DN18253_c0_g1_i1.p1  ORF type:complete len:791 (+),score=165.48 TRINITY_DN18253_c0_g1_i1:45-2417(+)
MMKSEVYKDLLDDIKKIANYQLKDKGVLGCSLALIDGQELVWAEGFGFTDQAKTKKATPSTIYRPGSISKLLTDIAIMQLQEQGLVDIDAPIETYLSDFHPINPFNKAITLRHLMTHTSGLVREPPVGSYFDPTNPSLAATVRSVNESTLVAEPGTRTKYSNIGVAVVGHALAEITKMDFAQSIKKTLLDPMGMLESTFEYREIEVESEMWRYDRKRFPAPVFHLGIAPAGCMYSNVLELSEMIMTLLNGGTNSKTGKSILKPETLKQMYVVDGENFPILNTDATATDIDVSDIWVTGGIRFGLGFVSLKVEDCTVICHGGNVYGFSCLIWFCPELNIGMATCHSMDLARGLNTRIGTHVFNYVRAMRNPTLLAFPKFSKFYEVPDHIALALEGVYQSSDSYIELAFSKGPSTGLNSFAPSRFTIIERTFIKKLKMRYPNGNALVVDDLGFWGGHIIFNETFDTLTLGKTVYKRLKQAIPPEIPDKHKGIIGEYGWDHNVCYVLERYGKLWLLLEFFFLLELVEISEDVFGFPPIDSFYLLEKVVFKWDQSRSFVTGLDISGILFPRRLLHAKDEKITPLLPILPTLETVKQLTPPKGATIEPERPNILINVGSLDPTIRVELNYSSNRNVFGEALYPPVNKAYLQKPAAVALSRAHQRLKKEGYGLILYDLYRPWHITKLMWEITPQEQRIFLANPDNGSLHNRGCAADVGLYELATGKVVDMGSPQDESTERSFADYQGFTSRERYFRRLLRRAMEAEGFSVFIWEWWHFDFQDAPHYPISNIPLDQI